MQIYETVMVVKPQLSDPEIAELVEKTKKVISAEGGEILNEDKWGRRKLTYPIKQAREGFYVYFKFQSPPVVLERLSHHFRVLDSILRTLTVQFKVTKPREKKLATAVKK